MKRIYIAGPMRGYPSWNFDAFDAAEAVWRDAGWLVVSPAALDRAVGLAPNGEPDEDHLRYVIGVDVQGIFFVDAIVLLPGWQKSSGTTVELALAQFLGLPVYDAVTCEPIEPPVKPWSLA